ncbi:MAG: autotransporter-associated beta strand repeat-containing protein, partial [Lacunisphaera sp.]|nr:autotransporter-associated beta strand repeat-containing protein [Lacunisphaera sp.]
YTISVGQNPGATSLTTNTGSITKTGAGTLALAGGIAGGLSVTGGEVTTTAVKFGGYANLTGSTLTTSAITDSTVTLNAGATLKAGASFTSTNPSFGATSLALNAADAVFDTNGYTVTFAHGVTGTGSLNKSGAGTLTLSYFSNTFSGNVAVNAGTLTLGSAGALSSGKTVGISSGATFNMNGQALSVAKLEGAGSVTLGSATLTAAQAVDSTFSGAISGTGGLTKSGAGVMTLAGTNTYSGATSLTAGGLIFNGSAASSAFTVSGGTLSGSGTIGALTIASGGTFSPGNSPGTFNAGNTTWAGGGTYLWELNNADGTPGADPGWDLLSISGTLTLTASSGNPFNLDLTSLTLGNVAGEAANFTTNENHTFLIASASGGITGFSADKFNLDATGFANDLAGGSWNIAQSGNNLNLVYTAASAIPEPSTYAALAGLGALGLALWRRRSVAVQRIA